MESDDCCCEIKPWCCTDFQSVMTLGIDQSSLASKESLRRSILSMLKPAKVYAGEAMSVDAPVRVDDVDHHVRVRSELIMPTHTIITSQPELVRQNPPKAHPGVRETSGDGKKCRDPKEKTLEEEEEEEDDDIDDEGDGEEDEDDDENADEEDDDDDAEDEDDEECEDEDEDCEDDEIAEEEEGEEDDIINACRDMKRFVPCRDVAGRKNLCQAIPYGGRCVAAEDMGGNGAGDCERVMPKICDQKGTAESTELGTNKETASENAELNELHEECMYIDKEELEAICKKYRRYDKKYRDKKSKTPACDCASPNKKTEKTKESDKSADIERVEDKKDECPNPCSAGDDDDDGDEEDEDLEEVGEEEEDVEPYFGGEKPFGTDPCLDQVTKKVTAEPVNEIEPRDYSRYDNKKATCGVEKSSEENSYFSDTAKAFQTSQQNPEQKINQPVPAIDVKHRRSRLERVYYDDQVDKKKKQQKKSKGKVVEITAVPALAIEMEESNYFDSKIVNENKAEKGKIVNNLVAESETPKVCPNVYYISSANSNNNNVLLSDGTQDNSENKDDAIDSDDDNNRGVSRFSFRKESEVSSDERKSNYSSGMMQEICGHVASENVQYSEDGDYNVRSNRVDGGAGSEIASPSSAHCTPAAAATENQSKYWAYGQSSEDEGGDGYFASGVSTSEFAQVAVAHSAKDQSFDRRRVPEPGSRVTQAEPKITEAGPTVLEQGPNAADYDPMYADYYDEERAGALSIDTAPNDLMIATLTSNRYEHCKRIFQSMRKRAFGEDFEDNFENCDDDDLGESPHRSVSTSSVSGKGPTLTSGSETALSGATAEDNGSRSGFLSNLFSMISKSGTMLHQHIGKRYSSSGKDDSEKEGKYFSIGRYRQKVNQRSPGNQARRDLYSKPGVSNFKFGKELNEEVNRRSDSEAYTEGIPPMARPTAHRWRQAKLDNRKRDHNFRFGQLLSNESSTGLHRAPCAHRHSSFTYKSTGKFNDRESFIAGFSFNPYQSETLKDVLGKSDDVMSRHSQNSFNKFRIFGTANQTVFEEKLEPGCQKNETEEGKLNGGDTSDDMQVGNNLINCITASLGNQLEPQIEQQAAQVSEVTESVALSAHVSLNKTLNSSKDLEIKLAEILPVPAVTGKLSSAATAADAGETIALLPDSRNSERPADLAVCDQHVTEAGDALKEFLTAITVTPDPPSQRDVQVDVIPDSNKQPTLEVAAVAVDENTTIRTTNITSACDPDENTNDNRRIRITGSVELLTGTVTQTVVITRESSAAEDSQQDPRSIATILGGQDTSRADERDVDTAHADTKDLVQKQCLEHVTTPEPNESVVANEDHCVVPGKSRHKFYRSQKSGTPTGVCSFKSKKSSSGTGSKSPLRSRNQQFSNFSKIKNGGTKKPCYHNTGAHNCRASHAALKKLKMANTVSSAYREENQNVNCLNTGEVTPNLSLGNVDSISFDAESQSADNAAVGEDHNACGEDKATSPLVVAREQKFATKLVNYSEHDLMNNASDCAKHLNETLSQEPAPYIKNHYEEVSKNLPSKIQILMGEVSRNEASLDMSSQKGVVMGVQLVNNNIIQLSEGDGVNGDAPLEQEENSGMHQRSPQTSLLQQLQGDIINKTTEGNNEVDFDDYKPIMVSNYINSRESQRLSAHSGKNSGAKWKNSPHGSADKYLPTYRKADEGKGMTENCNADTNNAESEKTLIRSQNQDEVYPGGQICSQSEHNDRGMLFLNSHYARYQDYNVSRSDETGNETVDTSYVESFIDKRNKRRISAEQTAEDDPAMSSEALSEEDMAEENCWSVRSFSPVATSWNVSDDGQDKVTAYWRGTGACGETICKGSRTEPYRFRERFTEWSNRTDSCVDSGQHGKDWFTNDHESDRATAGQAQVQKPATNSSSTELKSSYSEPEKEKEAAGSHGAQKEEELKQEPRVRSWRPIKVNTFLEQVQESCYKKFASHGPSQETESDNFGDNVYETESADNEWYTSRSTESDRYVPELVMVPTFLPEDGNLKDETVINRPDDRGKEAAPPIARNSWKSPRLITEHDQSMFGGNEKTELPANTESPENEPIKEDKQDRRCKMKELQLASCTFPRQSSEHFAQQRLVNATRSGAEMKEMQLEQSYKKYHTTSRIKSQSPVKSNKMPEINLSDTSCPDMGLQSEPKLWPNTECSEVGHSTAQAWGNLRHKEVKDRKSVRPPYRYNKTKQANPVTGRLPSYALRGKAPEIPMPVKNQTKTEKDEKIQANETPKETKPQARMTNSTKDIKTENTKKEKPSRIFKIDYDESKKKNGRINGSVHKTSSSNKQKSSQADANKPTQNETLKNITVPQQTNSSGYLKHETEARNISEHSRKSKPIRMSKIDINETLKDRHKANTNTLEQVQKAEQNTILSDVMQALHNAFTGKEDNKDGEFKPETEPIAEGPKKQKPARVFKLELEEKVKGKNRRKGQTTHYKQKTNEAETKRPDQAEVSQSNMDSSTSTTNNTANVEKNKPKMALDIQRYKQKQSDIKISENPKEKVENSSTEKAADIFSNQEVGVRTDSPSADRKKEVKYPVLYREERKRWKEAVKVKWDSEKIKTIDSTSNQHSKDANHIQIHPIEEGRYQGLVKAADVQGPAKPSNAQGLVKPHNAHGLIKSSIAQGTVRPNTDQGLVKPNTAQPLAKASNIQASMDNHKSKQHQDVNKHDRSQSAKAKRNTVSSSHADTRVEDKNAKTRSKGNEAKGSGRVTESKTAPNLSKQYARHTDIIAPNIMDNSLVDTVARAWIEDSGKMGGNRIMSPRALIHETSASQSVSCSYMAGPTILARPRKRQPSTVETEPPHSSGDVPPYRSYPQAPKYHEAYSVHSEQNGNKIPDSYFDTSDQNYEGKTYSSTYTGEEQFDQIQENQREMNDEYVSEIRPFYHVLDRVSPDDGNVSSRPYYKYNEEYRTGGEKRHSSLEDSLIKQEPCFTLKSDVTNLQKNDTNMGLQPTIIKAKQKRAPETVNKWRAHDKPEKRPHDKSLHRSQAKSKRDPYQKAQQQENTKEKSGTPAHSGNSEAKGRLFSYKMTTQGNRSETAQSRSKISQSQAVPSVISPAAGKSDNTRIQPGKALLSEHGHEILIPTKIETSDRERNEVAQGAPAQGLFTRIFNTLVGPSRTKAVVKEEDVSIKEQHLPTVVPENVSFTDSEKDTSKHQSKPARSCPTLSMTDSKRLRHDYKKNMNCNADSHDWNPASDTDTMKLGTQQEQKWLQEMRRTMSGNEAELPDYLTQNLVQLPQNKPKRISDDAEIPSPLLETIQKQHIHDTIQWNVIKEMSPKKTILFVWAFTKCIVTLFIVSFPLYVATFRTGMNHSIPIWQPSSRESFYGTVYLALVAVLINKYLQTRNWTLYHLLLLCANKGKPRELCSNRSYLHECLLAAFAIYVAYSFQYPLMNLFGFLCFVILLSKLRSVLVCSCCGGHTFQLTKPLSPGTDEDENEAPCPSGKN